MTQTATKPVIAIHNLTKTYKTGEEDTIALNNISLSINEGEFVAIMGPSGSGKSTLMHIMGLLDTPTNGTYRLDDKDVSRQRKNRLADIRGRKIGFVFQQFNLLPRTTVVDNILLPTVYANIPDRFQRAEALLKQVGLEDRAHHTSNQLSGGQIQRVAIARALVMNPSMIMADEPTGNLDTKRSHEIMELFQTINDKGATIVLITHEEEVAQYADRIIRLKDGHIMADSRDHKRKGRGGTNS